MTLVLIILFSGMMLNCAREEPEPISTSMAQQLAYLPDSGVGLVYLNIRELRDTDFFAGITDEKFEDRIDNRDYREFVEKTGFDFIKDLDEFYMTLLPGKPFKNQNVFLFVRGRFEREKILAYIKDYDVDKELKEQEYNDQTIYRIDEENICFSFLDDQSMVAGREETVKNSLDKMSQKMTSGEKNYWISMVKPVKYKSGGFFTINTPDLKESVRRQLGNLRAVKPLHSLESINHVNMSFKLTDKLFVDGYSGLKDERTAELFYDALKGAVSMMKLSVSEDRSAVDVLNKITIRHKGSSVRIRFDMSLQEIEKLFSKEYKIARLDF